MPESESTPLSTWRERLELLVAGPERAVSLTSRRAGIAAAVALAMAAVVIVIVVRGPDPLPAELIMPMAGSPGDPALTSTVPDTVAETPKEVVVHGAGAVVSAGVYRLAEGARVADVIAAAGGAAPGADLDRVNLAALVVDGQRVYVPLEGETVPPAVEGAIAGGALAGSSGPSPDSPLDLNSATAAQLDDLPGIGPAIAEAILEERERRGAFQSVDDLLDVRGIGATKLAEVRPLVTV